MSSFNGIREAIVVTDVCQAVVVTCIRQTVVVTCVPKPVVTVFFRQLLPHQLCSLVTVQWHLLDWHRHISIMCMGLSLSKFDRVHQVGMNSVIQTIHCIT